MISPYNQAPPASGFLSTEEEDQNFPEEYQNFPHSQNYYDCHILIILYPSSIGRLLKKNRGNPMVTGSNKIHAGSGRKN